MKCRWNQGIWTYRAMVRTSGWGKGIIRYRRISGGRSFVGICLVRRLGTIELQLLETEEAY
jgi:hypothetical protein